ncbi:hypothetical protein GCM10010104_24100 [Streptomyces indiaensis]|uniref:Uncharacterized protein n=1 Tax=Streptomyces indiaensis TaxID=284033 RepID=A0ABN3DG57_9ACTN
MPVYLGAGGNRQPSRNPTRASTAVLPFLNSAQAAHPAYGLSWERLCEMGALTGAPEPHCPKAGGGADRSCWEEVLETAQAQIVRAAGYGVSRFGPRKRKLAWQMESRPSITISTRPSRAWRAPSSARCGRPPTPKARRREVGGFLVPGQIQQAGEDESAVDVHLCRQRPAGRLRFGERAVDRGHRGMLACLLAGLKRSEPSLPTPEPGG